MRDRLSEIKSAMGPIGVDNRGSFSLDSHSLLQEMSHPFFNDFFETVEAIKNACRNIELAASTIDSMNDASAGSQQSENFDTLERVVLETNAKIQLVQNLLRK
jgi:hypothetical protein